MEASSQFSRFLMYDKLGILDQYQATNKLRPPFKVSQLNPTVQCMLACNAEPKCGLVSLDVQNNCALFKNMTTNLFIFNSIKLFNRLEKLLINSSFNLTL